MTNALRHALGERGYVYPDLLTNRDGHGLGGRGYVQASRD